jgi:hypothetical protein
MNLDSAKGIWDYLKKEYQGNERTKNMQVLNLIREFEMQKMKESENIKDYADRLLSIINKVRFLGKEFFNDIIVQKILVTMPKKYESKISSLEESKDLTSISLGELTNALQAQEQRRSMRLEESMQGAFQVRTQYQGGGKDKRFIKKKKVQTYRNKVETFPPCAYCKKKNHQPIKC